MAVRSEWRSRLFWLDALCINQMDPSDKAQQVPLMSDIFHKAHKVIVWLGPSPDSDGSLALSAIHMLWTRITLHVEFGGELETADIPAPVWASIRRMLLAAWLRRTWVVQEVVLARGITPGANTIIRYGDGSLDWQTLSWFIRNIRSYPAIVTKLLQEQTPASTDTIMSTIRNLETIHDFNTITFPGLKGISLTYYMTRMFRTRCDFQTKEDKDRIYGLLALPDKRTMSPAVSAVDYGGQTDAELFTKVAIHTLEDERIRPQCRIDFLAHAGLSLGSGSCTSAGDLPSWVPNWNLTSSSDGSAPQPPYPFLGLDGLRELTHGHMDYLFCRYIADMKTYGDINWGYEFSPGTFHGEYMGVLGKRLINTRKAFYRAGIPPEFINKENGSSEMEPRFELILAGNSGTKPKLKVRGVPAARIAHLAEDVFPNPGSEREIILLPKARKEGQDEPVEMEEYLNPRAFLPPSWRTLAVTHGLAGYPPSETAFVFSRTIVGDLTRREVDLKHDLGIPARPMALAPPVSTMLGYEHLVRLYFGHKGGLYTPVAAVEQPRSLRDILERHPTRTSAFGPPSPGTTQPEEIQGDEAMEIVSELIDLNKQVSDMCGGRMFGVTAGGKMGIFPAGTRVDDAVVVFWGSTVPFVLRKASPSAGNNDGDNYQLVGACYVHGIMDGEALEGVEAGEGSDFVIV
ncbi:heterokaryon incompatibility protein-domain-containing protein [Rhypophila decipiens]|uniref:Heterokaryon incompatibility protein-domain-containing protein n=1 Tax=Rhypophila decipiens TaxID=261697 RepID=A0AAN6Y207_9PEZI|nr:heterokaryon incompatibility protein-domain-containing protein [Rhypophila decipiens]